MHTLESVLVNGDQLAISATDALHDRARDCVNQEGFRAAILTPTGYGAIPAAYGEAMSRPAEAIAETTPERLTCAGK